MKDQQKNHSILKVMLLAVYLVIILKPCILFAQNTESQQIEQTVQSQEELNQELLMAVSIGRMEEAGELIVRGADVNSKNWIGLTPLHIASQQGNKEIAEFLIDEGADLNAKIGSQNPLISGFTPLSYAVVSGNKEIIELLISKGVEVTIEILNLAEQRGNAEIVELMRSEIDVDSVDEFGLTPLHIAAAEGDVNNVEFLIEQGASIDVKDNAGRTPLHYAAGATWGPDQNNVLEERYIDIVGILLDKGADINAKDNIGWTPLHYATRMRYEIIIEFLLERGADTTIMNARGQTPFTLIQMMIDEYRGHTEATQYISRYINISNLLPHKPNVYYVSTSGNDTYSGTEEKPFYSINTAVEVAEPGDSIIVRSGTYPISNTIDLFKSGYAGRRIRLEAYPGELPILDFCNNKGIGIKIEGAYWHIKGLTIINSGTNGLRMEGENAYHNIIEQLITYNNHKEATGIIDKAGFNLIINCDSYQNFDPETGGENSDGFYVARGVGKGNVVIGCRSWNNSDDGFDMWNANNPVRLENCYAWSNGENIWNHPFFTGNGNGFKLGGGEGRHILIQCMAWDHHLGGFSINGNETGTILYGCMAVDNLMNYRFPPIVPGTQYSVFRNNISVAGGLAVGRTDSQFNSWDSGVALTAVTNDDFLSLDDSQMSAPRNPDGSIPYNNFLKLAPGSAAIDAGTDVNMPYIGTAPDLGAFEYNPDENGESYVKMLHQYVRDHDIDKINEMLEAGTDINEKDWLGYAPLHWACYFGYADLVSLLIDKGADPNLISDTGRTSSEIATAMDYGEITEMLKNNGVEN